MRWRGCAEAWWQIKGQCYGVGSFHPYFMVPGVELGSPALLQASLPRSQLCSLLKAAFTCVSLTTGMLDMFKDIC